MTAPSGSPACAVGEQAAAAGLDAEVLVVGAGPVGLLTAGELRLCGVDVLVVDRLPAPTGESRASQLASRTAEILDQRGLLDLLERSKAGDELESVGHGHFGGLPLDVSGVDSHRPGFWKMPQFRTEAVLAEWLTTLGVEIRRGHELVDFSTCPTTGNVLATVATPTGVHQLRAGWLVGCDGEDSTVRRLAGIGFPGTDAGRELLRADVAGIEVRDRRFERHEHGLAIAARRPDGVTRVMVHEFGSVPARARDGRAVPDDTGRFAEVCRAWQRVTGEDVSHGRPLWVDSFGDASRHAEAYRAGRVLLAGDAAHLQMPAGGQALNLGLQDAVNLGWKLAAEVRGWAPAGLLDSYHDERHPVGARIVANVRAQTELLLGGPDVDPVRAVLTELMATPQGAAALAATASGLDIRYSGAAGDHPLAGARLPHTDVVTTDGATTTSALLHRARALVLDLTGEGRDRAAGWADRVDHVQVKAHPGSALGDVDAVLVRPDGHVAWVGAGGYGGLTAALRRWFGEPAREDTQIPKPEMQ